MEQAYVYKSVPNRAPACDPGAVPVEPDGAPSYSDVDARLSSMYVLGTDVHHVPAPLERMIENVLDWEHLPFVHPENFATSELLGQGPGWYRARFGSPPVPTGPINDVLVAVHPSSTRWLLTMEAGPQAGLVVHADAIEVHPDRITVLLTFYLAARPRNEAVRKALLDVYRKKLALLYDQDVAMMVDRQTALEDRASGTTDVGPDGSLGEVEALRARAPFVAVIGGRRYWIRSDGSEGGPDAPAFEAFAADCPHMFGPLPCPRGDDATVVCPWHAYRFDAHTGRSADGRGLRLAPRPALTVRDGRVFVG